MKRSSGLIDLARIYLIFGVLKLAEGQSGRGMGLSGDGLGGQVKLRPTEIMVQGAIMDTSNKFVQRGDQIGTNYFAWKDSVNGGPTFRRREVDFGKRFIMFPDRSRRMGAGHFIVLRKMYGFRGLTSEPVYEAFRLRLTDMIQAWVTPYIVTSSPSPNAATAMQDFGLDMMSGMNRFKRDFVQIEKYSEGSVEPNEGQREK